MVKKRTIFAFLAPALVMLFVFKIYPIVYSVVGSFFEIAGTTKHNFVGLQNYIDLFHDPEFGKSVWVTFKFTIISTPIQVILALLLAVLLNQKVPGVKAVRSIVFLPITVAMVVTTIIWRLMLDPNSGLINSIIRFFGGTAQPFLTSPKQALNCIILMCSWNWIPYWSIFFLAGIQQISPSVMEAATIDGANAVQKFTKITMPLMTRSIAFVTISNTISNSLLFSPMYMLTKGGPQGSTKVLMLEAYQSMFVASNLGKSYAIMTLIVLVLLIVVSIQSRMLKADY